LDKFGLKKMVMIFLQLLLRQLSLEITYVMLNTISISRRLVIVSVTNNAKLDVVRIQLIILSLGTSLGVEVYKVIGLGELVHLILTLVTKIH